MFLAFFHVVVLCVTLSAISPRALGRLPSAVRAAALLGEWRSDATLKATQTANVPAFRESWERTPPVSGPYFLLRHPLCALLTKSNRDSQYQAKLSACTQQFLLCTVHLANTKCIRRRRWWAAVHWVWPSSEFSKLFECYLQLYLCKSNNFHCIPLTRVR